MRRFSVPWRRVAAVPFLAALVLVSGCQQADLPSWAGGTKPQPPAPAPVVQAPPRPSPPPAPAPQAKVEVKPLAPLPQAVDKEQVRAALLLPLSGPFEATGKAMSNAAQMALFDVGDERFNLLPFDTHGTPEGAVAAVRQAIAQGADIVLGPLFSAEVRAASPLTREAQVPMVAFTTDRSAVGNGVYALGILPEPQVRRVVGHARGQGFTRIALLAPGTDYGQAVAEALRAASQATGTTLVKTEFYDPKAHDHTAVVKRFTEFDARTRGRSKESTDPVPPPPFDAVLIPDTGTSLRSVAALLTYYEVDPSRVKFLGTMLWDDPKLAREAALEGGWYPAPPTADHEAFERRYAQAFGPLSSPQVGAVASLAYDAAALAAKLARGGYGDYPAEALTNPNGFAGVDGIFRLLPDGTAERGLAVREIARGGSREVGPAPTSFTQPGY